MPTPGYYGTLEFLTRRLVASLLTIDLLHSIHDTVDIGYSDNAGGIDITAKLSL